MSNVTYNRRTQLLLFWRLGMNKRFKKWISGVVAAAVLVSSLLVPGNRADAAGETLLNTYGSLFGYSGT